MLTLALGLAGGGLEVDQGGLNATAQLDGLALGGPLAQGGHESGERLKEGLPLGLGGVESLLSSFLGSPSASGAPTYPGSAGEGLDEGLADVRLQRLGGGRGGVRAARPLEAQRAPAAHLSIRRASAPPRAPTSGPPQVAHVASPESGNVALLRRRLTGSEG